MKLKVWVGIVVSVVLFWASTWNVDFGRAWAHVQEMDLVYLWPYLALVVAEVLLRALKWQVLVRPVKACSFRNLTSATLIGLMANNLLPARAGEFVRAYVGARMERIPFSTCFATVVIDRVLDGLTVSAIFAVAVLLQPLPEEVKVPGTIAAAIYVVALGVLVGLLVRESVTLRLLLAVIGVLPPRLRDSLSGMLRAFVGGLGVLSNGWLVISASALSVVIWLGYALTVYIMALAFGIQLTVLQSLVVLLILTIMLTLPSTPGFFGAMELAIKIGLVLFGVDESRAFAFALVYHISQYVPITVGGIIALWVERLGMREIAQVPTQ